MGPVREDELQALVAGQLAHLDREPPVDRPRSGHPGDDAPRLLPLVGHDPCDQLSGSRGGLSTRSGSAGWLVRNSASDAFVAEIPLPS